MIPVTMPKPEQSPPPSVGASDDVSAVILQFLPRQKVVYRPAPWADRLIALVALAASLPVILVLMLLVRVKCGRGVVYTQQRVGRAGRLFTIYKIRTMRRNAEAETGPIWSHPGDPRVTPVGLWLRKTHLDELPQLWNVVRGEMGLVGPRPERPEIITRLKPSLPNYDDRHTVTPGLTGLAQLTLDAQTDLCSAARRLAVDLAYIERRSWRLDCQIVAATVLYLLRTPRATAARWLGLDQAAFVGEPQRSVMNALRMVSRAA